MTDSAASIDALVIGAGPVGLFQVFQLGLQGVRAHLVDTLPMVGGQCAELYPHKPIYDIPGIPVCTGQELVQRLQAQIAPFPPVFHGGMQVAQLAAEPDGRWRVQLQPVQGDGAGPALVARTVFITAGVGAFVPKLLRAEGLENHGSQVHYHPALDDAWLQAQRDQGLRHIAIHGGDEPAVQAAVSAARHPLLADCSVALLYRRDQFSAPEPLLAELAALREQGRVQVLIGMPQRAGSDGSGRMQAIDYMDAEGEIRSLPVDQLWIYLGLSPKLGPLADWGLQLAKKQLVVATDTFQTSATAIYAAGDISSYPGKRKLILTGFYEATMAALAAVEYLNGAPLLLEYTTTSKRLQQRLGVLAAEAPAP
ncbi:NAD(P)/FAD-dependent oxidoreductase [Comamonas humi]